MSKSRWIVLLCAMTVLGQAVPSRALGFPDFLHRKAQQDQVKSCVQQKAWIAYFKDDKGALSPVRDPINTDNDQDWMGLRFTEYDGPRIRLGVLKVVNKSAGSDEHPQSQKIEVPVAGIQEMLTVALYNTKRFDVIEQKRIGEVERQQTRKDVIEPSPAAIQNAGKVLDAQYLVYGTVNEWTPDRGKSNMGPSRFFRGGKSEAEVSITFTLTDIATGQSVFTTSQQARTGSWNFAFADPSGGNGGTSEKTPVSYAVRACANKAAFEIARFLRDRKWKGTVVDVKKNDIYINAGLQQGMSPQTKLSVQAVEGIVKDPETHMVLGEDLRGIGTLEVISVQNAFSVARVVESSEKVKQGDRVELATNPTPPPPIPACDSLDASAR